jgi:hypothetical protein
VLCRKLDAASTKIKELEVQREGHLRQISALTGELHARACSICKWLKQRVWCRGGGGDPLQGAGAGGCQQGGGGQAAAPGC